MLPSSAVSYLHSFLHPSIVRDVYVCVYMHSHVSYGVDMEIEGQLKGVGSSTIWVPGIDSDSCMVESAFIL